MELSFTQKKSIRKSFGKLKEGLSIPNLIEVQKNSYQEFLSSKAFNCFESSAASTTVNFDKSSIILFKSDINDPCN